MKFSKMYSARFTCFILVICNILTTDCSLNISNTTTEKWGTERTNTSPRLTTSSALSTDQVKKDTPSMTTNDITTIEEDLLSSVQQDIFATTEVNANEPIYNDLHMPLKHTKNANVIEVDMRNKRNLNKYPDDIVCPFPYPCVCVDYIMIQCASSRISRFPNVSLSTIHWSKLDFSENLLVSLDAKIFLDVSFYNISLANNIISKLHPQSFYGLFHLSYLNMSHNILTYLSPELFVHSPRLLFLDLSYNRLERLDPTVFKYSNRLETLNLESNDLKVVPNSALEYLHNLNKLSLRNNRLKVLGPDSFYGLYNLTSLDLGGNFSPFVITTTSFCGLHPLPNTAGKLQTILLDHNGLSSLDPCLAPLLSTLKILDLSGNPLLCDCRLLTFRQFSGEPSTLRAQCAAPSSLAGRFLSSLHIKKFNCSFVECPHECPIRPSSSIMIVSFYLNLHITMLSLYFTLCS